MLIFYSFAVAAIFSLILNVFYYIGKEKGSEEERRLWVLTFSFLTPSERQLLRERMDTFKKEKVMEEEQRYMGN